VRFMRGGRVFDWGWEGVGGGLGGVFWFGLVVGVNESTEDW